MYLELYKNMWGMIGSMQTSLLAMLSQEEYKADNSVKNSLLNVNLQDVNDFMMASYLNPGKFLESIQVWSEKQASIMDKGTQLTDDVQFRSKEWNNNDFYQLLKENYLILSRSVEFFLDSCDFVDEKVLFRMKFFSRQWLSALSPANYIFTNPEVIAQTIEQQGKNLSEGFSRFLVDLSNSGEVLNIPQVDKAALKVGEDVAVTPGAVVFKNQLFELIQYTPLKNKVYKTPLLIVPPIINKYYILDLSPANSMVRWLLEQGHQVFMISWRNPDSSSRHTRFQDYVLDGVVKAVNVVRSITGVKEINAAGYCIGGTLLATTMAYYAARRMKHCIKSASYFTTILDFSHPGDISAFFEPSVINAVAEQNRLTGYMDGRMLNVTFNALREKSLYWQYYVSSYLQGKNPGSWDLLFWSNDSMNVPAPCWSDIVQEFYLKNSLILPRAFKVGNYFIDLTRIETPSYFISTNDDHIALWKGTYKGARLMKDNATFVLGNSGHVAGIVNHPSRNKYGYWVNSSLPEEAEAWLAGAEERSGSWWEHWLLWLESAEIDGQVEPCSVGNVDYPVLMGAPGQYVLSTV